MKNTENLIHYFPAMIAILLASMFVLITTTDPTPPPFSLPPAPGACANAVISFSPCLPYISAPPNNLSDNPSSQCCDIFTGAFRSGEAECLCYLVRQNTLLGFPLNASKLLSLSDLCFVKKNGIRESTLNSNDSANSLDSVCGDSCGVGYGTLLVTSSQASPTLPPLLSTPNMPHAGPGSPKEQIAGSSANSSSTKVSPNSAEASSPSTPKQTSKGNRLAPATVFCLMAIYFLSFYTLSECSTIL